jgi:transcriptional regulator of acetoin/glycerol metabolism
VRELENALEYAATVCPGQTLQPEDLPPEVLPAAAARRTSDPPPAAPASVDARQTSAPLAALPHDEAAALRTALERHRWSRADTAKALGVSRSTLWRRMRACGLCDAE